MSTSTPVGVDEVRKVIHDYIVDNFLFGEGDVADDASLIDEGILDSLGVLEMVLFAEERLGVAVTDAEVVPDNVGSVDALVAFVTRRLAATPVQQIV